MQIPLYPTAAAADSFVLLVVGLLQHTMGEAEGERERGREGADFGERASEERGTEIDEDRGREGGGKEGRKEGGGETKV